MTSIKFSLRNVAIVALLLLFAIPAFGAVAFDASSEIVRTDTTSPQTWTHTPVSTPRAVAVMAVHGTSATDHCSAVSYGGFALTRKRTATDISGEPGRSDIWFLGTGIPTGAQTVSATCGATTDDIHFVAMTFTAATDTEVIDSGGIEVNIVDPSLTMLYGGRTAISVAALYGGGTIATFTPNANCTAEQTHDFGAAFFSSVIRQTTVGTVDFAIGGTAVSDDVAFAAVAISEIIAGFPEVADELRTSSDVDALTYDVLMPVVVAAGDLLLIGAIAENTPTAGSAIGATGWTTIIDGGDDLDHRIGLLAKEAVGTEDGTLVTVTINTATNSLSFAAQVIRISAGTWIDSGVLTDDVKALMNVASSSANPDPPSLTPGWTEDTLWLTMAGWATSHTHVSVPATYTNAHFSGTATAGSARLYTAWREANAAAEDPGVYTISGAAIQNAITIAVRPAAAAATFPVVVSITQTSTTTDNTDYSLDLPATVGVGDLLLAMVNAVGPGAANPTITGWTQIRTQKSSGNYFSALLVKDAIGNEDGTTVTVAFAASMTSFAGQVYRITGWADSGSLTTDVQASSVNASSAWGNPPSLTPTGGSANILWIVAMVHGLDDTISAAPTSYTNLTTTDSGAGAAAYLGTARRELAAATDDPGAFTHDTAAGNVGAWTIAVRPGAGGGGGEIGSFPICQDCTQTTTDTDNTDYTLNLPAVVNPSELLLTIVNAKGPSTASASITGWTLIGTRESNNDYASYVLAKDAVGTEDGTSPTVAFGASMTSFAAQVYRITSWADSGTLTDDVQVASANAADVADSPTLTPTGGAGPILWISAVAHGLDCTVTVAPANYSNFTTSDSGTGAAAYLASARRELNAAVTDPGTFTEGCTGNIGSWTIAVRPAGCPSITLDDLLSDGTEGVAYTGIITATGGSTPYTYLVLTGSVPAGLTLDASGLIAGTPSAEETASFTVQVTDNNGCTGSLAYSVTISPPPTLIEYGKRKIINTGFWNVSCFGNCQRGFVGDIPFDPPSGE